MQRMTIRAWTLLHLGFSHRECRSFWLQAKLGAYLFCFFVFFTYFGVTKAYVRARGSPAEKGFGRVNSNENRVLVGVYSITRVKRPLYTRLYSFNSFCEQYALFYFSYILHSRYYIAIFVFIFLPLYLLFETVVALNELAPIVIPIRAGIIYFIAHHHRYIFNHIP